MSKHDDITREYADFVGLRHRLGDTVPERVFDLTEFAELIEDESVELSGAAPVELMTPRPDLATTQLEGMRVWSLAEYQALFGGGER